MKERGKKNWILLVLMNLLAALTLAVLADLLLVIFELGMPWQIQMLTVTQFAVLVCLCFLLSFLISVIVGKTGRIVLGGLLAAVWMAFAAAMLCWNDVSSNLEYEVSDQGKTELYGGKRVMLLVPHQDDDINVLGGVLEEYVKYGSEVYVVFSTNGDYFDLGAVRLQEAIDVLGYIGIPEDHVIFLGYGDHWNPSGPHIYNAESGVPMVSALGRTETYGLPHHPAYRDKAAYTSDQFFADIEDVILEHRPQILYCIDYDLHIDHRALSLGFEKVMGRILNREPDYRPLVLKGFGYYTAWLAEPDFHRENLLATQNIFAEPYCQEPAVYRWEDRVRLPVHGENLSRSVLRSNAHKTLAMYASQYAGIKSSAIFSSDKVFWQRSTESLCHGAEIQTSSGNAQLLNDFMLLESADLVNESRKPYDGVWIPDAEDGEKMAYVALAEPQTVETIVLYDHPDPEENVLDAVIHFSDGTHIKTGPLDPGGAATVIPVNKEEVSSFAVILTQCKGSAGLTEVEAYGPGAVRELTFIKLMDAEGNFAYDYWLDPGGRQEFAVYTGGSAPEALEANYSLSCSNSKCSAVWQGDRIVVECPEGESCEVTVSGTDGRLSDTVVFRNPPAGERKWKMFWLNAEAWVLALSEENLLHERLVVYRLYSKLPQKLEALFS